MRRNEKTAGLNETEKYPKTWKEKKKKVWRKIKHNRDGKIIDDERQAGSSRRWKCALIILIKILTTNSEGEWRLQCVVGGGGKCLHKSDGKSSNREREKDNVPDEEYCLSLFCYCIFFFLSFIHLKFKEIWKRKTLKRSKNSKYRFFLFFFPPDMKLN